MRKHFFSWGHYFISLWQKQFFSRYFLPMKNKWKKIASHLEKCVFTEKIAFSLGKNFSPSENISKKQLSLWEQFTPVRSTIFSQWEHYFLPMRKQEQFRKQFFLDECLSRDSQWEHFFTRTPLYRGYNYMLDIASTAWIWGHWSQRNLCSQWLKFLLLSLRLNCVLTERKNSY